MPKKIEKPQRHCCKCNETLDLSTKFYKTNSGLYAGTGYLPICKDCLGKLFDSYVDEYENIRMAIQLICLNFDLYFNDGILETCKDDTFTSVILGNYVKRLNMVQYRNKTFKTSIEEGFDFGEVKPRKRRPSKPKEENEDDKDVRPKDVKRWGAGFNAVDYEILNEHYQLLKNANPNGDSNQDIFIDDLCYIHMQKMKALREDQIDTYNKLTESYRKSFQQAGLKTVKEGIDTSGDCWGMWVEICGHYCPEEYYLDKDLYKDFSERDAYYQRMIGRPLRNLESGTNDRDEEFYVHDEDEEDDI